MKEYLKILVDRPLNGSETSNVFSLLLDDPGGQLTDAQIGAYLLGSSLRGISAVELIAGVRSLREHMVKVPVRERALSDGFLLDTAGTGGSGLDSFNTSTLAALVIAASGQIVTKHGNRAASSKCGSADLLEALGVSLDLTPEEIVDCAIDTGFCFMFAPRHHPATKRVARVRKELGFRTIFNFLGPLCNPAGAETQLLGVSEQKLMPIMAEALLELGTERAMLIRGEDGLDEMTLSGVTEVYEINEGAIRHYHVAPEDFGLTRCLAEETKGFEPAETAALAIRLLSGELSSYRDIVVLNAGAGLYVAKRASDIAEGIRIAEETLDSGSALELLEELRKAKRV